MEVDEAMYTQLLDYVSKIKSARFMGDDDTESLAAFERECPGSDVNNLCNSDYDAATIVDVCIGSKDANRVLSKPELLTLIVKLCDPVPGQFAKESEAVKAVNAFNYNCRHPAKSDLIFFPKDHFEGNMNPTPEIILEKAIKGN